MRAIQIDDDVFAYVRNHAVPYEDKDVNDTLRRLFGISRDGNSARANDRPATGDANDAERGAIASNASDRLKSEKASLRLLSMRVGPNTVKDGQILYLHDHRGAKIPDFEATIIAPENKLLRSGKKYSMSELAEIGLKFHGYRGKVSGPRHWHTADGVSIRELWERTHPNDAHSAV